MIEGTRKQPPSPESTVGILFLNVVLVRIGEFYLSFLRWQNVRVHNRVMHERVIKSKQMPYLMHGRTLQVQNSILRRQVTFFTGQRPKQNVVEFYFCCLHVRLRVLRY
ncbi:hypothetical protein V8G54_014555 [Vigna mungo]|uniref:Uncharacterized protein n=1 Tax=Vigna mungo TaxID=3915 RepID=A0AAQ3NHV5_VIGMU